MSLIPVFLGLVLFSQSEEPAFEYKVDLQVGGIHGHPSGTRAGARTARKVVDAVLKGESMESLAERDPDVGAAYKIWGHKKW